jgi:hypothetical protein
MCTTCPDGQEPKLTKDGCKRPNNLKNRIGTLIIIVLVPSVVSTLIVAVSFLGLFLKFKKKN